MNILNSKEKRQGRIKMNMKLESERIKRFKEKIKSFKRLVYS